MKIHCIRHEPFEGLAHIESWIKSHNGSYTCTHTYLNQQFPEDIDFDLLIIMGGTASVYQEKKHPWLKEEKEFVKKAIRGNLPILGICLGAQILADVLGAKVFPGVEKEIGWFPVRFNINELKEFSFLPKELNVFHFRLLLTFIKIREN